MSRRTVASLFSGIGGFEAGFAREGWQTELMVENYAPAQAVLRERFPDAELVCDIRDLAELPPVDLLTAGFPCQDLSSVGRKVGIKGTRSRLVGEVFRLLEQRRVPWVVLENVPFILQLARGQALTLITASLEELGYSWAYRVVDAHAFGLPQRRRRWILVASQSGSPEDVLLPGDYVPPVTGDHRAFACGFYWTEGMRALGWAVNAVPPIKGGSAVGVASPPAIRLPNGNIITPDIRDAERLQGFDSDWTLPAESMAKPGFRWQLVGNAVPVTVAHWVARRLTAAHRHEETESAPLARGRRWPYAAWSNQRKRWVSVAGIWPENNPQEPLLEFLKHPGKPLSARAAAGFLRRTEKGSLRFPPGFREEVAAHAVREGADPADLPVAA